MSYNYSLVRNYFNTDFIKPKIIMIPKIYKEIIDLGDGRTISIETGKLAKQAHGSVVVQMGKYCSFVQLSQITKALI